MKKRRQVVLVLMLALVMAFAPVTALAAGWQYSADGNWGINIVLPQEGQTIYTDMGFTFEFDIKVLENTAWDDVTCFLRFDSVGNLDVENVVKYFDIGLARSTNGTRWSITLDVSDVQPGDYVFLFGITNEDGSQIAADYRNVTIVKRSGGWEKFSGGYSYKINGNWVKNKWELIGGKWYRFNSAGYMLTNWQQIGGSWYYLGSDGAMRTGWQAIGGKWYCFNNSGILFTNCWLKSGSDWYMISTSGAMMTGWQKDAGSWYYMQPSSGKMQTGWLSLGGKWYYLDGSGKMATGTRTIGGTRYTFNSSGVWVS